MKTKVTIKIEGDCICGCGGIGEAVINVNKDLGTAPGKYATLIAQAEETLYCTECFMHKITGLPIEVVQNIVSSSSED